ncbi:hypothetical protein [Conchiformibius kuhniae]|uniref:Uncharacterized protein n=1 Tax=Conchiformibius kuhniae TaxID=211502 RepID=A0A8T9MYD9_9NEIS|nr:hypothetical protein [Conchiformibius kuhniae]UOP04873.1 hypothetical protein LVJ77_00385 [Conchiformibius kuhniae]
MQIIKNDILKTLSTHQKDGFSYQFNVNQTSTEQNIMHGSQAYYLLLDIFYAYSVGQKDLFDLFLPTALSWLNTAIALKQEVDWKPRHVYRIYQALAGVKWLQSGQDSAEVVEAWRECLAQSNLWIFEDRYPRQYSASKGMTKDLFYSYLQQCLFARDYQRGIEVYQHFKGDKPVRLTAKTGLVALMYAVLRHYAYGEYEKEKLNKTMRQVLGKELRETYTRGHMYRVVHWLKTMCTMRERIYTPEETILTFYEFLEDDEIPDEIHVLLKAKNLLTKTDITKAN